MRLKSKRSLDSQNRLLKNTQELPRSSLNCVIFETQWSMAALGLGDIRYRARILHQSQAPAILVL